MYGPTFLYRTVKRCLEFPLVMQVLYILYRALQRCPLFPLDVCLPYISVLMPVLWVSPSLAVPAAVPLLAERLDEGVPTKGESFPIGFLDQQEKFSPFLVQAVLV